MQNETTQMMSCGFGFGAAIPAIGMSSYLEQARNRYWNGGPVRSTGLNWARQMGLLSCCAFNLCHS